MAEDTNQGRTWPALPVTIDRVMLRGKWADVKPGTFRTELSGGQVVCFWLSRDGTLRECPVGEVQMFETDQHQS